MQEDASETLAAELRFNTPVTVTGSVRRSPSCIGGTVIALVHGTSEVNMKFNKKAAGLLIVGCSLLLSGPAMAQTIVLDMMVGNRYTLEQDLSQGAESERGYRRQHCVDYSYVEPPSVSGLRQDVSRYDTCYGSLTNRTFTHDGKSYTIKAVFHYMLQDTFELAFTRAVDAKALDGVTFQIQDTTFAVSERHKASSGSSRIFWVLTDWDVTVRHPQYQRSGPALTVSDVTVTEGVDAAADFIVTLDPAASVEVTVEYATSDGTGANAAVAGEDYAARTGTLTFAPGETKKTVSVPILDDTVQDSGETFTLTLSNPAGGGAHLENAVATATIDNDEWQAPALTAEFLDLPASHGGEAFTVELAFSEHFSVSYRTLRDHAFTVTGGAVTKARRLEPGKNRRWEITVEVDPGADDVTVTLPATSDCAATGAICTADSRGVSEAVSLNVPRNAPARADVPFTVAFAGVPLQHDGSGNVVFEVRFSKNPGSYSYRTLRDATLDIRQDGQRVTPKVRRRAPPSNEAWQVTVTPVSNSDMTITIAATTDCSANGAVCADGERLSNDATATVLGPPGLSVADAQAEEAAGATVDFAVTLGRAFTSAVTVDYATSDGIAAAGSDYTSTSGTLTFAPGETLKTVSVAVLDDSHDEGAETFTLTLSNPQGGNAWLSDASAVGTIANTDPMPQTWLARFGRTVAEQVVDAIRHRIQAPRTSGAQLQVAGKALDADTFKIPEEQIEAARAVGQDRAARTQLASMMRWLEDGEPGDERGDLAARSRTFDSLDLLGSTAFSLTGESGGGALVSVWGRGAVSQFDGREDTISLDGEVETLMLGADWSRDAWITGVLFSHSRGDGDYRGESEGRVESTLTGFWPYSRYQYNERLSVWGIAGYGEGDMDLKPEGATTIETDIDLLMGAVGVRGIARPAPEEGGLELAITSDALVVRTGSDRTTGLASSEADVTRMRLGLEGAWHGLEAETGTWVPSLEAGIRHDGGDAETGFGADVGIGLAFTSKDHGIAAEIKARGLITHEESGFENTGISASMAWDPRPASLRGPTLTLSRTVGSSATGGMDALLGRATMASLHGEDHDNAAGNRQLEMKFGYGFAIADGQLILTPELGLGRSSDQHEYQLGTRLDLDSSAPGSMQLDFRVRRRESVHEPTNPEHAIGLQLLARF